MTTSRAKKTTLNMIDQRFIAFVIHRIQDPQVLRIVRGPDHLPLDARQVRIVVEPRDNPLGDRVKAVNLIHAQVRDRHE